MSDPAPHPSFRQRLIDLFHPFRSTGGFMVPHILLIAAILLAVAFAAGWFVGTKYDSSFFRQHYSHDIATFVRPHNTQPVARVPRLTAIRDKAHVNRRIFPGPLNQDGKGACASFVTVKNVSFYVRKLRLFPEKNILFNPWVVYYHYGHGADEGSTVEKNVTFFADPGIPLYSDLPAAQLYPNGLPAKDVHGGSLAQDAASHRVLVTLTNGGAGQNAVNFAVQTIASGNPVQWAFGFFNEFYDPGTDMPMPATGEQPVGGHEETLFCYDFHHRYPDGHVGLAFCTQNNWGSKYCIHGWCWVPAEFISGTYIDTSDPNHPQVTPYLWDMTSMSVSPISTRKTAPKAIQASKPTPRYFPPQGPTIAPPKLPPSASKRQGSTYWLSSRAPYASIVNAAGKRYGISPLGMEATFGTESGMNPYAFRYTSYYDHSCGLSQITIPTARGYGLTGSDEDICNWLYVPSHTIYLTARMFADFKRHVCWSFAPLYASWNLGYGYGCRAQIYVYPTNPITQQALANWKQWRDVIRARYP